MTDFTFDHEVPMPENNKRSNTGRKPKYPIADLYNATPGASWAIKDSQEPNKDLQRLKNAAYRHCRANGIANNVFVTALDNDGNPRIWRTDADQMSTGNSQPSKRKSGGSKKSGSTKSSTTQQAAEETTEEAAPETVK